jgi:MFS family permease
MPPVTPLLGYMSQHLAELTGSAVGVVFIGFGLFPLITGRTTDPSYERFRGWRTRALGAALIALGVIFIAFSFLTNAEPPGQGGNPWGDSWERVVAGVWLLFLGGVVAIAIRREVRDARRRNTSKRQIGRAN